MKWSTSMTIPKTPHNITSVRFFVFIWKSVTRSQDRAAMTPWVKVSTTALARWFSRMTLGITDESSTIQMLIRSSSSTTAFGEKMLSHFSMVCDPWHCNYVCLHLSTVAIQALRRWMQLHHSSHACKKCIQLFFSKITFRHNIGLGKEFTPKFVLFLHVLE